MHIDKEIWLKIGNGDEIAYENMYSYYFRHFYLYGQKFTDDLLLIEDVIQEIMIYIWHHRSDLPAIKFPAAYFFTSFRNLLLNKLKMQGRIVAEETIQDQVSDSPEHAVILKETDYELDIRLKKAAGFLTPRQNEAIHLRFYEELSYEEVSAVMGITVKATYKIMARALQELKKYYVKSLLLAVSWLY